ncbi:hypothetical protein RISK_002200 [Rhodopirellula islandica]|uniref:Uncharacterized protein n=1 Tax=Rhodopirellula islandica TaxID=595434 RepID=A0A0J1BGA7_RHOIS|nr:hypothetical protein RISK_002200 [Rhodopirellula islandica]
MRTGPARSHTGCDKDDSLADGHSVANDLSGNLVPGLRLQHCIAFTIH